MGRDHSNNLYWEKIDIISHLEKISKVIEYNEKNTPPENTRTLGKFTKWKMQLARMHTGAKYIQEALSIDLSKAFNNRFDKKGLISISLFQPSTKNFFLELHDHFCIGDYQGIDCEILSNMVLLPEMAKVLALIGDAAIDMAVLHHLWRPNVADVGSLTQDRANIVSNEHLAEKSDDWNLYDNRIHFDPETPTKSEIDHIKGTLVEALFGVVYIESGFEAVKKCVKYLIN
ncbi:MAG: ribonuclease III domain-containing protein [Candidatus Thorarchaeota archaeon]